MRESPTYRERHRKRGKKNRTKRRATEWNNEPGEKRGGRMREGMSNRAVTSTRPKALFGRLEETLAPYRSAA